MLWRSKPLFPVAIWAACSLCPTKHLLKCLTKHCKLAQFHVVLSRLLSLSYQALITTTTWKPAGLQWEKTPPQGNLWFRKIDALAFLARTTAWNQASLSIRWQREKTPSQETPRHMKLNFFQSLWCGWTIMSIENLSPELLQKVPSLFSFLYAPAFLILSHSSVICSVPSDCQAFFKQNVFIWI